MRVFGSNSNTRGSSRGCFVAFDLDVSGSEGAVLRLPDTSNIKMLPNREAGGALNYPLVVVGVSFNQNEIAQFLKCFGGKIYTYAFGNDLGDLKVDFVGFLAGGVSRQLGAVDQNVQFAESNVLNDFVASYKQSRLSASRKLATLSMAGGYLQGLIIGMQSGTMSAENNLQSFSVVLKLIDVQGGNLPLAAQPGGTNTAPLPAAGVGSDNLAAAGTEATSVPSFKETFWNNGQISPGLPQIGTSLGSA
jgi:hypothetical protein